MAETGVDQPAPAGYLELVRGNRDYRSLWMGEVVSLFGDWFNLIASAALIAHLTSSGLAVGGLFVVRMLAPFLVSPLAGVVADRYNRKGLLIAADLSRAVVVLGFLLVRDARYVGLLYLLTAIQLGISGFFFPARNAIFPDILARREIGAANALSSATWSVMLALGSALGGVVAGEWGIYPAFIIDSLTFLVSAFFIAQIQYRQPPNLIQNQGSIGAAFRQYLDGLSYLRRHLDVLAIALHKGAISLTINGVFQVVQVALAERVFVIGEGGGTSLGLLYAAAGIGTGLGPILARRFTGDRAASLRAFLSLSYLICIAGILIMAPLASFPVVLLGSTLRALGGGINWVYSTTLLLQLVPGQVRGRVFSTEFGMFTLANALGAAAGGWILDNTQIDLPQMLWWMAGLTLIPALLWTAWISIGRKTQPNLAGED